MSQGIYKITNKLNQKCYIGKSKNIEERWKEHTRLSEWNRFSNKPLYKAFQKYGLDNFTFEIIEELDNYELSNQREKYWIQYYNSYREEGYNATIGGDGGQTVPNPRESYGNITTDEVIYLRKRYIECKYPSSLIYEKEFKNKISKRGFQAIWLGDNAKDIMPEVFTQENKTKQMKLSRAYEGVLRRKISLKEKLEAKKRIDNGEPIKKVWKELYTNIYSYSGFKDMIHTINLDERINFNEELTPL